MRSAAHGGVPARRAVVIGGAVAVLAGAPAGPLATESVGPAAVTTTTTPAPTTTATGVTTTTSTSASTGPLPSLPEPASRDDDPAGSLVPRLVSDPRRLADVEDRTALIAAALADGTNTVAVEDARSTICAVVPVTVPVATSGRWERDGEPLDTDDAEERRDPPGFGECLVAAADETLEDGVYQYSVVGATGARSAVATLVVGVAPVTAWLLNDGRSPVCLVLVAPGPADRYEAFATDSELLPGEALAVPLAAVEHDVQVYGCPPDDVLRQFRLTPEAGVYVPLFEGEDPGGSAPATSAGATSTTVRPTTTTSN